MGRRRRKKRQKNDIRRWACSQKSDAPMYLFLTQSFLLRSSWSSDNITASNKESISKSLSVFRVHKIIVISLLCQYGLFIHTSRLKTWFFYLLWYNTIRWSTHTYKKDHFFYFIVCCFSWITQRKSYSKTD